MTEDAGKKEGFAKGFRADAIRARDEAKLAPYRTMTTGQRVSIVAAVCRTAVISLNMHPDPQKILRMRPPLPESSRRLWARLREGYRWNARKR
ncbi:MAG: hypothetical protein HY303_11860 [Candidatus Wallbacteria bacterium]|nr:hypothetical protein [Candidatus Wallbacteria bacterium]